MATSNTKQGVLVYDEDQDRIDIRFGLDDYYVGLHCGETFDVKIDGKWIPTRIEKAYDWFLTGVKTKSIIGLIIRM